MSEEDTPTPRRRFSFRSGSKKKPSPPKRQLSDEEMLQQQVKDLRRLLEMKDGVLRSIDDQNTRLKEQLASSEASVQQLTTRLSDTEQQHTEAQQRVGVLERQLEATTQEKANLEAYAARTQMAMSDLQHRVAAQQQQQQQQQPATAQQQGLKASLRGVMAGMSLERAVSLAAASRHDSVTSSRIEEALAEARESAEAAGAETKAGEAPTAESATAAASASAERREAEAKEAVKQQEEAQQQQQKEEQAVKQQQVEAAVKLGAEMQQRLRKLRQEHGLGAVEDVLPPAAATDDAKQVRHSKSSSGGLLSGWRLWQPAAPQ